ncbi:MAG TPA: NADH-quinone oxidoreductase subunit NuoE [Actinocrinis sp.]|nr:NADH-quinone oxidoreductase subunit NuoE [Actinocrinis sp.]HEV2346800.1 NADH-quinone oxidoreductase subunit NuoE [Actinocrinis sp.]
MTDVSIGLAPHLQGADTTAASTQTSYADAPQVRERLVKDAQALIARYPKPRSALLPLLHLVQSEEGYVSGDGVKFCAEMLGLSTADVSAVSTFYSMYKRKPVGDYHVGVCTNTLCAVMGGDEIFATLKAHLAVGNDERTAEGQGERTLTLEHIECNAACDFAPVMTVNWEFFDNMTPRTAVQLVDDLLAGHEVTPSRGPALCSFKEMERILAGFEDERPDAVHGGGPAGPATLEGLKIARRDGSRVEGQV